MIVLIFKPCFLPIAKDESLVTQSIESTLVVTGKGHVLYVEDDPSKVKPQRIREIREEIVNLFPSLKSQLYSNDSIPRGDFQGSSTDTKMTVHTLKDCRPAHPSQHTAEYGANRQDGYQTRQSTSDSVQPCSPQKANQDVSFMKGFVMLRARLQYGRLSHDVEIHYPGFIVPQCIEREMYETYKRTYEAVVEIISDGKGGYTLSPSANRSLVQLGENETVMLKTRLCNGLISLEKGKLEFIYPEWKIRSYVSDDLKKKYHLCSDRELCIISNDKGELRYQVVRIYLKSVLVG